MKKIFLFFLFIVSSFALLGCSGSDNAISSEDALATMTYLSAELLDLAIQSDAETTSFVMTSANPTEVEENIDDIHNYMYALQPFMDNAKSTIDHSEVSQSTRAAYTNQLQIQTQEQNYYFYYDVDGNTGNVTGTMVLNQIEYMMTAYNTLGDKDSLITDFQSSSAANRIDKLSYGPEKLKVVDDNGKDNPDPEKIMTVSATRDQETLMIQYMASSSKTKGEAKYTITKTVGGVTTSATVEIQNEGDEKKIKVQEATCTYEFGKQADGSEYQYRLQYTVNGTEGEIQIKESAQSQFSYRISEGGKTKDITREKPAIGENSSNSSS